MNIKDYLFGSFGMPLDDSLVYMALSKRGVDENMTAEALDLSAKEIMVADIMTALARSLSSYSNDTRGGDWAISVSGGTITAKDRNSILAEAQKIYRRWGCADSIDVYKNAINV